MKPLSKSLKQEIINKLNAGCSVRKTAQILPVSKSAVQRLRQKLKIEVKTNVGGRPRILNSTDTRRIVRYLATGEASTASHASALVRKDTGKLVSKWTVQRALHSTGFRAIEKKKKPLLSKKNIKARLEFVKRYEKWTTDDWSRVIWSDETKINRYCTDGRQWNWKREGEKMNVKDFIQTVKHGGGNVKVWGCMTVHGTGSLRKIDGIMRKETYLDILKTNLTDTIENMPVPENEIVFQHDNDPKHTAKIVKDWLHKQDFQVLQWPAQSPDLNPIENLWSHLKRALLNNYDSPPSSVKILWERIQEQWDEMSPDYCEKLIRSMPRRLEAVKKAKGLWTKY